MPKKHIRPSWDDYFMKIVETVAQRGTCDRGYPACVIVKENQILTTGYAGSPSGLPHCDDAGHIIHEVTNPDGTQSKHCIRTIHAEQNAIVQAARFGTSIDGGTLYTSFEPCYVCAKLIINSGIKRVVCGLRYHGGKLTSDLFKKAGVKFEVLSAEEVQYKNKK